MPVSRKSEFDLLSEALRRAGFEGDIEQSRALRAAMSTDNSVYQIPPDLVLAPRAAGDLVCLLKVMDSPAFADLPVTARGGGTGTNGQSLNRGVIIDMRRHMNRLLAYDTAQGWADVEPGMVLDDLNNRLRPGGWFFAPETSTSTRCTIGGMVSTDASGKGSRVYGKTSDNLLGLEIARPEGLLNSLAPPPTWARAMLEGAETAVRSGRQAFIRGTPRLNRRFTGYDLERACPDSGGFEWWRLFPGSEGTLGLITRVRVSLRRIEPEKRLLIAGFNNFRNALSVAVPLERAGPTAVEVMDERVQSIADKAGVLDRLPHSLRAHPGRSVSYVFIEINGATRKIVEKQVEECFEILAGLPGMGGSYVAADLAEIRDLWRIRSAAVGLLGKVDGPARPVAFVEDTVVPPNNLPAFIDEFLDLMHRYDLDYGIYGHADVGCLHFRPALNLDEAVDRERLVAISDSVFRLTRKYGGIFWGEHGKGVRGIYLEIWLGPETYKAFQGVKAAFDPKNRFNPGKLVSVNGTLMGIGDTPFRIFNADENHALQKAFRCNGNAQCLSYEAATTMCPSFKATADVRHSPKGRADALRDWYRARASGDLELPRIEADLLPALDGCLGCKACATACPVQVDIPTMRSVFYAEYFRTRSRSLADRISLISERTSPVLVRATPFLSRLWPLMSRVGGLMTGQVDLPRRMANTRRMPLLSEAELDQPLPPDTVILVQDWFTALFDDQLRRDVVAGFEALGYSPRLLEMMPAGKVAHSLGDVCGFSKMAGRLSALLAKAAGTGAPLVALDPAFGMTLRQEYVQSGLKCSDVLMPQEFLVREIETGRRLPRAKRPVGVTILSHCTERSVLPDSQTKWFRVFLSLGLSPETPETGCCGMAGMFGHMKRHQKVSRDLFDLSWRDKVESDAVISATGFSCRCQSERLAGRPLRHPMGVIADLLVKPETS